jgi:hypothetical protein
MTESTQQTGEDRINAKVTAERDRIVKALRELADRIERANLDRVSEGLTWVATAAETLVKTIERALKPGK